MIEYLRNLLKIKSIVTIAITGLFVYMAITGKLNGEQVLNIFAIIIGFYFGTQTGKE